MKQAKRILPLLFIAGICVTRSRARENSKAIKAMTYNILHGEPPWLKHAAHKIDLNAVAKVDRIAKPGHRSPAGDRQLVAAF